MAGLGFRVAAVPFHFYAPDVYQGSPTIMAALLAWVPKAIGFLAIVRTLTAVVSVGRREAPLTDERRSPLAWIIAVVTMTLGNTVALLQDNLKRLLAYSSIAHAGYLMIGVAVAFRNGAGSRPGVFLGSEGVLFYLVAYALMTLGCFRRDHRAEHARAADRDRGRPGRAGQDAAGDRPWRWPSACSAWRASRRWPGFYGKFAIFTSVLGGRVRLDLLACSGGWRSSAS